jgi:cyclopropane fatty-acyl-phospholipid synthase-like methyltransferase
MDIAARMVAYCRRTYPQACFRQGELRDASSWGTGTWDALVAGWALIDVLGDEERATFFDDAHRLLNPGGLLLFSSHNLACAPLLKSPVRSITVDTPLSFASQVVRLPRSYRNHRRLTRWQRFEPDYAILNGAAHDFSLLHYYISRDGQERQLERHGFELLECIGDDGSEVGLGETGVGSHELHYAALRSDTAPRGG